ncbi:MAG TPA: hypothetical protein VK447_05400 [Myxococcaceae bacterium]|nr:hypothetical protein [Myxococcaceae bacterium]
MARLRDPDGAWLPLPGAIGMGPESGAGRLASGTFFTSGVGGSLGEASARDAADSDVVLRILHLRLPGAVMDWWASGPAVAPERWTHPLSEWERKYLEKMSAASVPEPVRMRPPVAPERLTAEQREEAERLFGTGHSAAQSFSNRENRRRIVNHYVMTHPRTVRMMLTQYGLARDVNPLFFAVERGWQVGGGEEMFTREDVSRLGAAAEFFTALAVGVAVNKVMLSARPAPPEGLRPPSEPMPGPRREGPPPPGTTGKVLPLDRAHAARNATPGTQPSPSVAEPPLASTGTDGPPGRRGGASRGPTVARAEKPDGSSVKSSGPREETDAARLGSIGAGDECGGQLHHVISKPIAKALSRHRILRGLYTERDPRFVTRAADKASHNGYQQWHRDVDKEVISWLTDHPEATIHQFEAKLREIYNRPAIRARFPDGI